MRDRYIQGHINRCKAEEKERLRLFEKLNKKAQEAAGYVGEKYQLKRVYLFGSLTDCHRFRLNSDIDIAVEGLK